MSTQTVRQTSTAKPYKGPESYQVEDTDLFFGRDLEAEQLMARILSSRFTLLHAQSGAGKTSLLNARVIPGLEARGWNAFRILPQNDPIESIRAATLHYLVPHPEAERLSVKRAWKFLAPAGGDPTLNELLRSYDELQLRDARRRDLVSPIELSISEASTDFAPVSVNTYFGRVLRSCIEVDDLAEHIAAVEQAEDTRLPPRTTISGQTRASELVEMLGDKTFLLSYNKLLNELKVPGRDLAAFFRHITETYGRRRTRFALVLVLDQFEEMFTRFIDPGVTGADGIGDLPDWRLRWELFKQLEQLHREDSKQPTHMTDEETEITAEETETTAEEDASRTTQPLPLRYVVSMRDEYIAQMDPLRRFVGRLEESSYHLRLLEKEQAKLAIQEPAVIFGYTYERDCFARIIQQLTKEDRFVEPAHLQLVCEKLWNEKGRELASINAENGADGQTPVIRREVFEHLGETKGILKSFFKDFLKELGEDEQLEVLEMLAPLVTASGTRNIMERDRLVNAPFRDGSRREKLLSKLVNHTVVRTEHRLGGYFVEITHEFLIGPILEALGDAMSANPEYDRYRLALRAIERLQGTSIAGTKVLLTAHDFAILHQHRDTIRWNAWSAELMLRSALASRDVTKETLTFWVEHCGKYGESPTLSALFNLDEGAARREERELLSLAEMRVVNGGNTAALNLSAPQIRLILRSELAWATDEEREAIRCWTERMNSHAK
jgi:hypothetical protein